MEGNFDVEYTATVLVTNNGEGTATVESENFGLLSFPNDFALFGYGVEIGPGETVPFTMTWNPSTVYAINPAAYLSIDFRNEDGCSKQTKFLGITGEVSSFVDPGDPPVAVERFVKVYNPATENPDSAPYQAPFTRTWDGHYYIRYDNYVQGDGFPEQGQVQSQPVFFSLNNYGTYSTSRSLFVQTSGITPEDNVVIALNAGTYETPIAMANDKSVAGAVISTNNPVVILDESILSQTQNADGSSTGQGVQIINFTIDDQTFQNQDSSDGQGTARLTGTDFWAEGDETNQDWLDNAVTEGYELPQAIPGGWYWEQDNTTTLSISCPSDVATNFGTANGNNSVPITYRHLMIAYPDYQGVNYGPVRNAPNLIRQYCAIPGCNRYDPVSGELPDVPVIGEWTNELYQDFQDFTYNQPTMMGGAGFGHPQTTRGKAPFKVGNDGWYFPSSTQFSEDLDRLYGMQIGKDCGGVAGCTNPDACNYDPDANFDDGSCTFPEPDYDCDGNFTGVVEVYGCTNPSAENYNPDATVDDGSCQILGCTFEGSENYNPEANVNDGSCIFYGCTDGTASNYNPAATVDDGSCEYDNCSAPYPCAMDFNGTGVVNTDETGAAWNAADNAFQANGYEEGTAWFSFREKYTAFADCSIEQIIAYFNLEFPQSYINFLFTFAGFTAQQGTGQVGIYECEDFDLSDPFPTICQLLDVDQVTLEKVNEVFTGLSGGTYEAGIDFDGDGVVTNNDYSIALELIGLTINNDLFAPCQDYDPGDNPLGELPGAGSGNEDDTKDNDSRESKYPKCEDFPEGEVACGCMDPEADNYDPMAKAHVQSRCSYSESPERRENRNRRERRGNRNRRENRPNNY